MAQQLQQPAKSRARAVSSGHTEYPHAFHNKEKLALNPSPPYQSFPLVREGHFEDGSRVEEVRVVYSNPKYSRGIRVLEPDVIYHTRQSGNSEGEGSEFALAKRRYGIWMGN